MSIWKSKLLFIICLCSTQALSNTDYTEYYEKQNQADSFIYILNDYKSGAQIYTTLFKDYDFVWLEDCLRMIQLGIFFKDSDMVKLSFTKAFQNGLELDKIKHINLGCPCTFYCDYKIRVKPLDSFINLNKKDLGALYEQSRAAYLRRIDPQILKKIVKYHVDDELFKVYKKEMGLPYKEFKINWDRVLQNMYTYISYSFSNGNYIGVINTGYYSEKLMIDLGIKDSSAENLKNEYYKKFSMKEDSIGRGYPLIPTVAGDYLSSGSPLFISYYHDRTKYIQLLTKYYNPLIKGGYLHPREYAVIAQKEKKIKFNIHPIEFNRQDMFQNELDKIRRAHYLPSQQIDDAKHKFAHKNNLQLFFGFFNSTR
jgi:hypothetical protein